MTLCLGCDDLGLIRLAVWFVCFSYADVLALNGVCICYSIDFVVLVVLAQGCICWFTCWVGVCWVCVWGVFGV